MNPIPRHVTISDVDEDFRLPAGDRIRAIYQKVLQISVLLQKVFSKVRSHVLGCTSFLALMFA